jgi:SAM-dependent MidA family methyltransferase
MQYERPPTLPQPDAASARHSALVASHIRAEIDAAGGSISFAEFMHMVLYAPELGYYTAGACKIGPGGDFVTAPEVSSVFGRVLARQCAEVFANIGGGDVLEMGAGTGKLALDMLRAFERLGVMPDVYNILEVSPDLRERQEALLRTSVPQLLGRVRWLSELPQNHVGVMVANEVLDALPVERFAMRETAAMQQCVAYTDSGFHWCERPAAGRLRATIVEIEKDLGGSWALGYKSEISLAGPAWIADIAQCLRRGAIFLFDYGMSRREYYAADRSDGWLRCHFRHHAHNNPLILPGIQDISAWVDFSAIATAAVANDLEILGFQNQAQFLLGGGLEIETRDFEKLSSQQQLELSGQIKTLTLPGEMGENFKCIALGCGATIAPSALHFADRTQTL